MTYFHRLPTPQRVLAWLRALRPQPFAVIESLDHDYDKWSPDPPIWERLIR